MRAMGRVVSGRNDQEPAVVIGALVHLLLGDGGAGKVEHIEIFQAGG